MYNKVELDNLFSITELYTTFLKKYPEDYSFPGEIHNFAEIVIVLSGKIGVTAGSNVMTLQSGQAILHPPMEFHRFWCEDGTSPELIIISFSATNIPRLKSRVFMVDSALQKKAKAVVSDIHDTFSISDISVTDIKNSEQINYQLAIKQLEIFVLRLISGNIINIEAQIVKSSRNYAEIIKVLEDNINNNLDIPEIAKLCKMSEINLKKTFSKYSGIGIKNFYNTMIMSKAKSLLKAGHSVSETASILNFENINYFSTAFKRITGKSPSYYKKNSN